MKIRTVTLATLLALLLWVDPAGAQKVYSLTVSVHEQARPTLTDQQVDKILASASKLLKQFSQCSVTFKRKGHVGKFSDAPNVIKNEDELEAVHRVDANVKVVQDIQWCKKEGASFIGCSWRRDGPKTMIVTQSLPATPQILWAHEFGHTTGLQHRNGDNALMSPCKLDGSHVELDQNECKCFLAGPGGCSIPDSNLACTTDSN